MHCMNRRREGARGKRPQCGILLPLRRSSCISHRHNDREHDGSEGPDRVEDEKLPDRGAHTKGDEVEVNLGMVGHEVEEGHQLVLVHEGHEREDGAERRHHEHHLDGAQVLLFRDGGAGVKCTGLTVSICVEC